ncbi:MAG: TIGR03936 family radical SAM-associated protein [Dehalococcoidia bacterium]
MTAQRIRVWFRKGERLRYISHLDVLRAWERSLRRAELPLAYSQGFTPHPKLAFGSPLPMGFVSEGEVMDVTLDERVDVSEFRSRLAEETTADLALLDAMEVAASEPAPQAAMLWADYRLSLPVEPAEAARVVAAFLKEESHPWREERGERVREYDLRAACAWLRTKPTEGGTEFEMRLQADQDLTARPEAIVAALFPGQTAPLIARTKIVLNEHSPARDLWRRVGQYQ